MALLVDWGVGDSPLVPEVASASLNASSPVGSNGFKIFNINYDLVVADDISKLLDNFLKNSPIFSFFEKSHVLAFGSPTISYTAGVYGTFSFNFADYADVFTAFGTIIMGVVSILSIKIMFSK